MIYDHFQATGAYDAAQGLRDLFKNCPQNDDVHDSVQDGDHILSGTNGLPHENVLEGFVQNEVAGLRST